MSKLCRTLAVIKYFSDDRIENLTVPLQDDDGLLTFDVDGRTYYWSKGTAKGEVVDYRPCGTPYKRMTVHMLPKATEIRVNTSQAKELGATGDIAP